MEYSGMKSTNLKLGHIVENLLGILPNHSWLVHLGIVTLHKRALHVVKFGLVLSNFSRSRIEPIVVERQLGGSLVVVVRADDSSAFGSDGTCGLHSA